MTTDPHARDGRPILVTGGAGFIGSNIAHRLAREGHNVIVYDALVREGVRRNLEWLKSSHGDKIDVRIADIRNEAAMTDAVQASQAVFHMAAQVAVTTSLVDPRDDFAINIAGTLNVLEAARLSPQPPAVIFASTNKVYGDLADLAFDETANGYQPVDPLVKAYGIGEARPLDFHTPYGCSKGAADQYVLDYARSYGVPGAVLRMSCIYGERQMGTEDQGWVAHFLIRALEGRTIDIYGDGHQVRDILEVSDAVDTYLALWRQIDRYSGHVFNLGGGPNNAVSLRTVLAEIEAIVGHPIDLRFGDWRAGDQRYFVADRRSADAALGLAKPADWRSGLRRLATWLSAERNLPLGAAPQPTLKVAV
ncbi:SDR family NAD(P)-dependent oxidoreductase [Sphingomonas sp. IC4-52]|uniref:SDR family NAD(P)-dependent oxidoreductase n=1 Tax=Sphingomonas sp. IC4-52 TaxID=2887202 RepID=UPI001D1300AE|nr:SDR family NAD(P)-dependent oxidoreductase [Sphingomonas sp. IC4-52]MCC2980315.1 SDR family NAD(P)-dependent oxidoreductase [Sphingomonas sp. IC4-52]